MTSLIAAIGRWPRGPQSLSPLRLYWLLVMAGLAAFLISNLLGGAGPVPTLLELAGSGTCGLSWLLARALFRPDSIHAVWPRVVVGSLFVNAVLAQLLAGAAPADEAVATLRRVIGNINMLTSSTVLLLGLVDALDGLGQAAPSEKRFRLAFAGGYGGLVFVAVILLRQSALSETSADLVKDVCAVLAGLGATAAVAWRLAHPLQAAPRKRRTPSAADTALADRIRRLMETERVFTRPDIKVADIARLAREPEYKVTQSITGAMGFPNFNRLVNHHRIALAKQQLADPALAALPILTIALDCGFASIGPFNRAFKEAVGMTPSAFREAQSARVET